MSRFTETPTPPTVTLLQEIPSVGLVANGVKTREVKEGVGNRRRLTFGADKKKRKGVIVI